MSVTFNGQACSLLIFPHLISQMYKGTLSCTTLQLIQFADQVVHLREGPLFLSSTVVAPAPSLSSQGSVVIHGMHAMPAQRHSTDFICMMSVCMVF